MHVRDRPVRAVKVMAAETLACFALCEAGLLLARSFQLADEMRGRFASRTALWGVAAVVAAAAVALGFACWTATSE